MQVQDLQGRLLGGAVNDGDPAFANVAGLDTSKIEILNFKSNLREQMLKNKKVEGVFGYVNTIRFSAKLSKQRQNYGMDLYSNGLIIPKAMAADQPEMVKGMVWAVNQGVCGRCCQTRAPLTRTLRKSG